MNSYMDKEIETIFSNIFRLGSLAERALSDALWALIQDDAELAKKVADSDDDADNLADRINSDSFETIARHQPVALDLRALETAIRMALDLERISDLAVNIARIASQQGNAMKLPYITEKLQTMGGQVIEMLGEAMCALRNGDPEAAEKIFAMDDGVDDMEDSVFSELMGLVIENHGLSKETYGLVTVSRLLERAGDHVTNICEQICYMTTGRRVKASEYRRPRHAVR